MSAGIEPSPVRSDLQWHPGSACSGRPRSTKASLKFPPDCATVCGLPAPTRELMVEWPGSMSAAGMVFSLSSPQKRHVAASGGDGEAGLRRPARPFSSGQSFSNSHPHRVSIPPPTLKASAHIYPITPVYRRPLRTLANSRKICSRAGLTASCGEHHVRWFNSCWFLAAERLTMANTFTSDPCKSG